MAVSWRKATPDVLRMANELIEQYHADLMDCHIGFLFRSEAPVSNGNTTYGKAKKVNAETNALLPPEERLDFVIWLAHDMWELLDEDQRTALIDHELEHCTTDEDGNPKLRGHDVEEFNVVLERHGFWWPGSSETAQAVQERLPLPRTGKVSAIDIGAGRFEQEGKKTFADSGVLATNKPAAGRDR